MLHLKYKSIAVFHLDRCPLLPLYRSLFLELFQPDYLRRPTASAVLRTKTDAITCSSPQISPSGRELPSDLLVSLPFSPAGIMISLVFTAILIQILLAPPPSRTHRQSATIARNQYAAIGIQLIAIDVLCF